MLQQSATDRSLSEGERLAFAFGEGQGERLWRGLSAIHAHVRISASAMRCSAVTVLAAD